MEKVSVSYYRQLHQRYRLLRVSRACFGCHMMARLDHNLSILRTDPFRLDVKFRGMGYSPYCLNADFSYNHSDGYDLLFKF